MVVRKIELYRYLDDIYSKIDSWIHGIFEYLSIGMYRLSNYIIELFNVFELDDCNDDELVLVIVGNFSMIYMIMNGKLRIDNLYVWIEIDLL